MYILGINAYHGDSAACLIKDGKIIAAIEEERIRRIKHWAGFPSESIKFCIKYAGINISDIDYITIGRNPSAHIYKKIITSFKKIASTDFVKDRIYNLRKVISIKSELAKLLEVDEKKIKANIKHIEHHRSHLASAFFASPFEEAALISIDGFGDFSSVMFGVGRDNKIKVLDSITYPHSLGVFYTTFTQWLGFPYYGDEYKVMGLAPYGEAKYLSKMEKILKLGKDGKFKLNTDYFVHDSKGVTMIWENSVPFIDSLYSKKFLEEFGKPRKKEESLNQYHKDIAASVQKYTENTIFHLLNYLYKITGITNLCIAGGVAQNSVANGKIKGNTPFKNIYIPSAAYDAGTSIGSALWLYHNELNYKNRNFVNTAYFGPEYSDDEIETFIKGKSIDYIRFNDNSKMIDETAKLLAEGLVVGWFQGRTEFGPRALGNRSILVHPGRKDAKDLINSKIKRRESFRPFAPSILREYVNEYFEQEDDVYFMEKVFKICPEKRSLLPAVTHVDGTGRLQTVHKEISPLYWELINKFKEKTGLPILLNTSFNENEPIINTPKEALDCYLRTEMDALVIGNVMIRRK